MAEVEIRCHNKIQGVVRREGIQDMFEGVTVGWVTGTESVMVNVMVDQEFLLYY